tara:strand:+ start:19680 stop:20273 length:594 start_codon:yes stop_codon:yes gene_type:complete
MTEIVTMRKVPSYLKGLAETRARVSAEVARLERLQADINAQLEKARTELTSCDTLIRRFDERLNPSLIQPVRAWKGRYGKRGALKEAVLGYLQKAAPEAVSTQELVLFLHQHFALDFIHPDEAKAWRANTLLRRLKEYVQEGLVERLHDISQGNTGEMGYWRWHTPMSTIADLAAAAAQAGVPTVTRTKRRHARPAQ